MKSIRDIVCDIIIILNPCGNAHTCMYTQTLEAYLHVWVAFLAKCDPINGHRPEARSH